jgi:hypothetical protein
MIVNEMWNGSGLGNQLACYVTTRCIALENGYEFGIAHPERFKAKDFLKNIDFGKEVIGGTVPIEGQPPITLPEGIQYYYAEKQVVISNGSNVTPYDWNLFKIPDNTKIDGLMQGEDYFKKYKDQIRQWLKPSYFLSIPENICIINFRGGEYSGVPHFYLQKKYWDDAITNMRKVRSDMKFHVVTDDPIRARPFFTDDITISHTLADDYISIQSANYLILSNSSFAFFPAWLNERVKYVIAPRYWGRHNISDGYWSLDQNYTYGWNYQDREGNLSKEK